MLKNKKLFIGIIVVILVIGVGITGVILMNSTDNKENQKQEEKPKDIILLKEELKFEINSELNLLSLVSEDNKVKVLSEDEVVDTSTLGEKEITIKYEIDKKEIVKTFKITIVDTQAPTIEFKKELSTTKGKKIDLLKGVKVSDNSKEEITPTIEGEYDINKEGTYKLKYVVVDSSNNKKEEEFTLKVNKKSTSNNNKTQNDSYNSNDSQDTMSEDEIREKSKKSQEYFDQYNKVYDNFDIISPEPGFTFTMHEIYCYWLWDFRGWTVIVEGTVNSSLISEARAKMGNPPNRDGRFDGEKTGHTTFYVLNERVEIN